MKIKLFVLSLIVIALFLISCSNISGEAYKIKAQQKVKITTPVVSIPSNTDISPLKNYVYVFTFDPTNYNIKNARYYLSDPKVEQFNKDYLDKFTKTKSALTYKLKLSFENKNIIVPFDINFTSVIEDFSIDPNNQNAQKLIKFNDLNITKEEIEVRVPTITSLEGKMVTLEILDVNDRIIKSQQYSFQDKQIVLINPKLIPVKLTGMATTNENKNSINLLNNSNESNLFSATCGNLINVIPNYNKLGENRINIIFIGSGYDNLEFVQYLPNFVDLNGLGINVPAHENGAFQECIPPEYKSDIPPMFSSATYHGLLAEEPFKSHKDSFNFWYYNGSGIRSKDFPRVDTIPNIKCQLYNQFIVNFLNEYFRSNAAFGGSVQLSFKLPIDMVGRPSYGPTCNSFIYSTQLNQLGISVNTFVHEMGHSIGMLKDEYLESSQGNLAGEPNCAPDFQTAQDWGWIEPYYHGCSYIEDNFRPTENSLMKFSVSSYNNSGQFHDYHFDYVNELALCVRISQLTGNGVCQVRQSIKQDFAEEPKKNQEGSRTNNTN